MGENKKYLKWYNKVGYGVGGGSISLTSAVINNFALLIMTDYVGLNAGIVGTMIMISKIFDGFSDVIFGNMIDRTHSKMGKARPWLLGSGFGVAICAVLTLIMPAAMNDVLKYAWFFVFYTAYNAIFYTAMSISYNTLTALVTKNPNERVQMGLVYNFIMLACMMTVTIIAVPMAGKIGWAKVAIIFSIIGLVCNLITVFAVKELPENELADELGANKEGNKKSKEGDINLVDSIKLLIKNRFYLSALLLNIMYNFCSNIGGVAIYYFTYVYHDANLFSVVNGAGFGSMIAGMLIAPIVVKKMGIFKGNLTFYSIGTVLRFLLIPVGLMGNVPLLILLTVLSTLAISPLGPTFAAITADIADYTYKKEGIRIDGSMFSCVSMGAKVGAAIGTGLTGWLLAAAGYVANAETQSRACINMMNFMYLILPAIAYMLMVFCLSRLNVQKALKELDEA